MTIKHINGNLFQIAREDDYLAHCISKDYALGAGIAVVFQRRFQLREKLRRTDKRHGIGYNVTIGRVFNLITKEKCWQKPTYGSLENALISMRDYQNGRKTPSFSYGNISPLSVKSSMDKSAERTMTEM